MIHTLHLAPFFTSGILITASHFSLFYFVFFFLISPPSVCLFLCVVHVCTSVCMHECTCGSQRLILSVFLYYLAHSVLSQALTESGAHWQARLPGQQTVGVLLAPHPQGWDYMPTPPRWFFTWVLRVQTQVPGCRQSVCVLAAAPKYPEYNEYLYSL